MDQLSHPPRPLALQRVQSQVNENTSSNTNDDDDDGCEVYELVEKFQETEAACDPAPTETTAEGQPNTPQPQKPSQPAKTDIDKIKDNDEVAIDLCDKDNSVRASI